MRQIVLKPSRFGPDVAYIVVHIVACTGHEVHALSNRTDYTDAFSLRLVKGARYGTLGPHFHILASFLGVSGQSLQRSHAYTRGLSVSRSDRTGLSRS